MDPRLTKLYDKQKSILDTAKKESRALTDAERQEFDSLQEQFDSLKETIDREKALASNSPADKPAPQAGPVSAEDVRAQELARANKLRNMGARMSVSQDVVDKAITEGLTVDQAVDEFAKAGDQHGGVMASIPPKPASVSVDERDNYRNATVSALCSIAGMQVESEAQKNLAGADVPRNMQGLVRNELRREGRLSANRIDNLNSYDLSREFQRLVQNSISTGTGDLTNILADTINKSLGVGYDESAATWQAWVPVKPVSDFKTYSHVKTSTFADMLEIPEGAPFKRGAFSDKKETGSVSVYGRSLTVSMQAIANDDLDAITRFPMSMGNAWSWFINKLIYDELYGSAGVGATLTEDSKAVFHTDHGNLITDGGAPSVETLAAGRKALRNMTAPKGSRDDTARRLNLVPRYLVVPSSLETAAEQIILSRGDISKTNDITINPFAANGRTPLELVVDAYLDSKTTTGWYLATNSAQMEHLMLLALNGQVRPTVRSEDSRVGEALGVNWDLYGSVGTMTADYRGLYHNDGTAE